MLPQASLMGAGVGGAAMEAELVDSVTGKQIGAVIESRKGSRKSLLPPRRCLTEGGPYAY